MNGMHANSVRFLSELNENASGYVFLHSQIKSEIRQFEFTLSFIDDVISEFIQNQKVRQYHIGNVDFYFEM